MRYVLSVLVRLSLLLVAIVIARPALAEPTAPAPDLPASPGPDDRSPDDLPGGSPGDPDATLHEDNEFGPLIQIERIDITGNTATQTSVIERALPISAGDV